MRHAARQTGYTLIELLLYISLVGALLISVTTYFATTADARLKNQSIVEVNQQGTAIMEMMSQTIRNATSITSPTTGTSGSSLTVVVPTAALSPTTFGPTGASGTLGYNTIGTSTDSADLNSINATKFTAATSGTISTLNAYIASPLDVSPNNKGQMAIYSGTSSPTTLLASSASVTLTADAWNTFPISTVSVTSGQVYWLAYNTNAGNNADNNLKFHTGTTNQSMFTTQTFNTWPASWSGTNQSIEFSMYANVTGAGGGGAQVQEGAGAAVTLNNSKVTLSGLTFKNLTRPGTAGIVQISFTVTRTNPNSKNEYDYQKTFTTSVALRP